MEALVKTWNAITKEPVAILMGIVAVVCAIDAIGFGTRLRNRILMSVVALISAVAAWILASGWRLK